MDISLCSPAPSVGLQAYNTAAFPLHHQPLKQGDSHGAENMPTSRVVCLGLSNKKPLFGCRCKCGPGQTSLTLHPFPSICSQTQTHPKETSEESPQCSVLLTTSPGSRELQETAKYLPCWKDKEKSGVLKDSQALPGNWGEIFPGCCSDCYQEIPNPLFP